MKIKYYAMALFFIVSGCQSSDPNTSVERGGSSQSREIFNSEYENRLKKLIVPSENVEVNVVEIMEVSLQECRSLNSQSYLDKSECASDSLAFMYDYFERNFGSEDVALNSDNEVFVGAVEKWLLYMSKVKSDPTYAGLANLELQAYYSVLVASKTISRKN
ncbi:hypothetical protein [Pseudomonas parafulva]|uniref:hypothetical protein n=1 Tax=Pseudomonas parafulva TaxID=157782 RepID=UPI0012D2A639|nr:hypothetical protein [Pseudomonas parafulva]